MTRKRPGIREGRREKQTRKDKREKVKGYIRTEETCEREEIEG